MSLEKMEMMNIIGHMDDIDAVSRRLILTSSVHMVNAMNEVQQSDFPILQAKNNVDAVVDYNYIRPYTSTRQLDAVSQKISALQNDFDIRKHVSLSYVDGDYNFDHDIAEIEKIYQIVKEQDQKLDDLNNENKELDEILHIVSYLKGLDIDLKTLLTMKYIKVKFGSLNIYDMDKLKKNYENVSAIVFPLDQQKDRIPVMLMIPEPIQNEIDRVLVSLNFQEDVFKYVFDGNPDNWITEINNRKKQIKDEISSIKDQLSEYKKTYKKDIEKYYSRLQMEFKVEELKSNIACTNEFFYLTGWVPCSRKSFVMRKLGNYEKRLIIISKKSDQLREGLEPPTCFNNNTFIRPFESMIRMYGIPSYTEKDPTAFFGISYMILFGCMFGDLGQGLVLFLMGLFLRLKKHRPNFGGILERLGISSAIFGCLYGSVFGNENIIKHCLIKPMNSINTMLIAAVIFGVLLLGIGFVMNIVNSCRDKDVENGLFSKNGITGMVFYFMVLYLIVSLVLNFKTFLPVNVIVIVLVALLALMLLKQPLSNLVKGVRPIYSQSKGDYFIENGFGIFETLLSMFSNTVSFIRVGAFAINHVGLFIAFQTLANMMTSHVGNFLMLVLGNIIIIGLEGLIVFIQGLRLEYYELFSKYYRGMGYEFEPIYIAGYEYKRGEQKALSENKNVVTNMSTNV